MDYYDANDPFIDDAGDSGMEKMCMGEVVYDDFVAVEGEPGDLKKSEYFQRRLDDLNKLDDAEGNDSEFKKPKKKKKEESKRQESVVEQIQCLVEDTSENYCNEVNPFEDQPIQMTEQQMYSHKSQQPVLKSIVQDCYYIPQLQQSESILSNPAYLMLTDQNNNVKPKKRKPRQPKSEQKLTKKQKTEIKATQVKENKHSLSSSDIQDRQIQQQNLYSDINISHPSNIYSNNNEVMFNQAYLDNLQQLMMIGLSPDQIFQSMQLQQQQLQMQRLMINPSIQDFLNQQQQQQNFFPPQQNGSYNNIEQFSHNSQDQKKKNIKKKEKQIKDPKLENKQ